METIKEEILIKPFELGENTMKTILWKTHQLKGSCNEKRGYITEIQNIKIDENSGVIQPFGEMVVFEVELDVKCYKPKKGEEIKGKLSDVVNSGIFVVSEYLKILISKTVLPKNTKYMLGKGISIGNTEYKVGDSIDVKIYAVKYENTKYKILGELDGNFSDDEDVIEIIPNNNEEDDEDSSDDEIFI